METGVFPEQPVSEMKGEEESLDPQDWSALRSLAHEMVEDMLTYLETVRERPVWQPVPEEARLHLAQPVPQGPQDPAGVYAEFKRYVLPYALGNIHPRFWGWVIGTGTPMGMLADLLAAGMNSNAGGGEQSATYVENQVVQWCREIMQFPQSASGILVSGGSMANLVGLTVAREAGSGYDLRKQGLQGNTRPLVVYGSIEMHSSIDKAVELLGLGSDNLRKIPVGEDFTIDRQRLQEAVQADRSAGKQPFCVVGNAGTVNTGAFDPLDWLADFCEQEGLWFHVDGAFGALAAVSPGLRHLTRGMERANSLAFDLHKWMYMPYEVGCTLVRQEADHRRAFSLTPVYLEHTARGLAGSNFWYSDYGVQLSRGFRALKVWMSIKENGMQKYGRVIQQNVDQAQYLAGLVEAAPELELCAPVPLNIVCFRYRVEGMDEAGLNELNRELLLRLHESGKAVPSYTTLDGRYVLRAAITNHRSRREDFDLLVEEVQRLGRAITAGASPVGT